MNLNSRISAFTTLGNEIRTLADALPPALAAKTLIENPWFTSSNIVMALRGVADLLSEPALSEWTSRYAAEPASVKTIGVAMAGNIPLVGFHDLLCVLISGHRIKAKLSSQDSVLMKDIIQRLITIEPAFKDFILLEERLNNADAMIATGGNNTARYFEYYFRNVPHIIRKNRSSCAVLTGKETPAEFESLSTDVFSYYGLGCRNISKLYVPAGYDFIPLMAAWENHTGVAHHHKYANNYDYQRGIMLINQISFYDNGVVLLKQESSMVSPIAMLFYEFYDSQNDLVQKIEQHREQLQCIVSAGNWFKGSFGFGEAQFPKVDDYADGVDTLRFLKDLN